jgi:hypothetical protein
MAVGRGAPSSGAASALNRETPAAARYSTGGGSTDQSSTSGSSASSISSGTGQYAPSMSDASKMALTMAAATDLHRTTARPRFSPLSAGSSVSSRKSPGSPVRRSIAASSLMRAARSPERLNSRCSPSSSASQHQPRRALSRQNISAGRPPPTATFDPLESRVSNHYAA